MKKTISKIMALAIFMGAFSSAWAGNIRGKIIDDETGEGLYGAAALISDIKKYGVADLDGNYVINDVPAGSYRVQFKLMGYQTSQREVTVPETGSINLNIAMGIQVGKAIVVEAKRVTNTAASLLSKQKKAAVAQDAISSEQIAKSPDSDASETAKRVTGVTVLGGKYIFVRGLSERYSSILVNGSVVPSPLPNKRVVPLDIFPTSIIDNLVVSKTFTPDMPSEFGGGLISINTREFPQEQEISAGLSFSYNNQTTFKKFHSFGKGGLDFIGYNDGTYSLPSEIKNSEKSLRPGSFAGTGYTSAQLIEFAKQLDTGFEQSYDNALPGMKVSFSYGNNYSLNEEDKNQKLGLLFSVSQKTGFHTEKGSFQFFDTPGDQGEIHYDYEQSTQSTTTVAQLSTTWQASKANRLKFNTFYTHISEKTANYKTGQYGSSDQGSQLVNKLVYNNLLFNQLRGEHKLESFLDSNFEWAGAFSMASRNQPDTKTFNQTTAGYYNIDPAMVRYFNEFDEYDYEITPALTIPFKQWDGLKSNLKVGGGLLSKKRNNESRRFKLQYEGSGSPLLDDVKSFTSLVENGSYSVNETTGTTAASGFDSYEAKLDIASTYAMVDLKLLTPLRLITGARVENWDQKIDSFSPFDKSNKVTSDIGGTEVNPGVNLVYAVNKDINIRTAYSRTINRPDFLEASNFRYYDDIETGGLILGNPDLEKATIDNYDLRFEWYPEVAEIIAISGFYKQIEKPIEATVSEAGGLPLYSFRNQKSAENYGVELEMRKSLGFIAKQLENFSFLVNYTYVQSKISLIEGTQEPDLNRALQGQSPWVTNAGIFYDKEDWGTSSSLLMNMFGRRIDSVSTNPDLGNIYEESYPKLDYTLSQMVGPAKIKLTVTNILDPEIKKTQRINGIDKTVKTYKKGISASLGASAKF